ncbi:AAA family ATPase [Vibrio splendidus]
MLPIYLDLEAAQHQLLSVVLPTTLQIDDPYRFDIRKEHLYERLLSETEDYARANLTSYKSSVNSFCFYCGTPSQNIAPAFLHDRSGHNLWMYKNFNSSMIICDTCLKHYGHTNIQYLDRVENIPKNDIHKILSFSPELLIPTLEPVHLHFNYLESGYLKAKTIRAERTINRLALNRGELVNRRKTLINLKKNEADEFQLISTHCPSDIPFIIDLKDGDSDEIDYFMKRAHRSYEFYGEFLYNSIPYPRKSYVTLLETRNIVGPRNFSGIESIKFNGLRGFDFNQEIFFNKKSSIIMLGENGVGKSTLLNLIKRALKEGHTKNIDDLCYSGFEDIGYKVNFTNEEYYYSYPSDRSRKNNVNHCNLVYVSDSRNSSAGAKNIITLLSLEDINQEAIDWILKRLDLLLGLPQGVDIRYENRNIFWDYNDERHYLTDLSSGYNSIISIFHKVISGIKKYRCYSVMHLSDLMGSTVALIDEVELHLHPKFKKNIISRLKSAFPEVIFIMSTHDPLVLTSSSEEDKVVLLEKTDSNKTIIIDDLPNHSELTTEQILSSQIFGLNTVDNNENLQKLTKNYYAAIRSKNTQATDLYRKKLGKLGYFGNSFRELLALSAVDIYLARSSTPELNEIVDILERADQDA